MKGATHSAVSTIVRLLRQVGDSSVGSLDGEELDTEGQLKELARVSNVHDTLDGSKVCQGGLDSAVKIGQVLDKDLERGGCMLRRRKADDNGDLALVIIKSGGVLRLCKGEVVVVDVLANKAVLLKDGLALTDVMQVIKAEVDTAVVDWDAGIEAVVLCKS